MTHRELRDRYIQFFEKRGHKVIPPAPLVLQNDPTTLFTSSGMQPLMPYLLGQNHPTGKRLVDSQPVFRAQGFLDDIYEVGDNRHLTLFEMLGNWSLGDYFKREQLDYFFTFLTDKKEGLGLDPSRIYVSIFEGDDLVPKDTESIETWRRLFATVGIDAQEGERIVAYGVKKNWWSRSGTPEQMPAGEPGGPDSEVFYQFDKNHDPKYGQVCHPNCDCGRFLEIGNSVFMQYLKQADGTLTELPQKNVDFGGGLARLLGAVENNPDIFQTDLYKAVVAQIEQYSDQKYDNPENALLIRVIADHLTAATFLIHEGLVPSNKEHGYVLRKVLRRAAVKMHLLKGSLAPASAFVAICDSVMKTYDKVYFDYGKDELKLLPVIEDEMVKFSRSLDKGLKMLESIKEITGRVAFDLYQSYGFPFEITQELALQRGQNVEREDFLKEFEKHQSSSRSASAKKFKGGLEDQSEVVVNYHTATHLLQAALRKVLGPHIRQEGSNLTAERLRFDFSHGEKLTPEQVKAVEDFVNKQIEKNLVRTVETMDYNEALKKGALAFFKERYPDKVTVYTFSDSDGNVVSREICGGPHVEYTLHMGKFHIIKEESVAAGIRRIYGKLD